MFDTIPVFPESGLQDFQIMKAFLTIQSLGPLHQDYKNGLFVGRMVM
jgi:hypothetical protein